MSDRLSTMDVSFLYMEEQTTAMHIGGVATCETPDGGFDFDGFVELIQERIDLIPRYRQKVRWVPGRLAHPVWVDDPDFDVSYHVRRSALPRPGTDAQLRDLVSRVQSRQLDRARPLWEIYVVEGLSGGRLALITKTHHAMADGVQAIDIGALLLDATEQPRRVERREWTPEAAPSAGRLVADAVGDWLRRPGQLAGYAREGARAGATDARRFAGAVGHGVTGLVDVARTHATPASSSPLNARIGEQRRYGMAATSLDGYKLVRKTHRGGSGMTVNDVVLATVAGALRAWLLTRGEAVVPATTVRAMVPVSVRGSGDRDAANRVSSYFVELPVGEPDPVVRLHQVSHAMRGHKESNQAIGAQTIIGLAGLAPSTVHAAAARLGSSLSRRLFNTIVTNVPGPQFPLYANGARLLELYPVVPLAKGQAVSFGVTSYNGGVYYGLLADRDAMPDVDVLAQCLEDSLAELLDTVR